MKNNPNPYSTLSSISSMTDDKSIRNIGIIVLLITFGILGTWFFFAPLDSSALASGQVTVKSHSKSVQHLDGGIVSQLLANDGDIVEAGDIVIKLDGTEVKAQLEILRGQSITLSAQLARLTAERERLQAIDFPENLKNTANGHIAKARQSEIQIFQTRKITYEGEISVLKQRISQLQSKINGLQGQRSSKQQLISSYQEEVKDLRELLAQGFADKQRLRDVERNYAGVTGEVSALTSEIATSEMQIGETKLQILQVQKQFQQEVANKLSEVEAQLYEVNQRLTATEDKVIRTDIRAPSNGRVLGLAVHNIGSVITPGKEILTIVPQQEELIINAQVSPQDIDRVHIGLITEVRFSAFNQAQIPKVNGKVINLSADRLIDEKTGAPYYQAQVELLPESFVKLKGFELMPGMSADVYIKTGERTVFEYLMQPVSNAFARAFIED